MRRSALLSVVVGLLVVVIGALFWWRPFLIEDRDYPAAIPQAVPLFTTPIVEIVPGQDVCLEPAVMDRRSEQARFRVATFGRRRGVPLQLRVTGPGYRFMTSIPADYADNELLFVPVRPPPRDISTRVCMRNAGSRVVAVYGVDDRTRSPLSVTRGGVPIPTSIQFAFNEARPVSLVERLPTVFDRMDTFRPGVLGPWLFWPLMVACAVGLPLAALWTLWAVVRATPDERDRPLDL